MLFVGPYRVANPEAALFDVDGTLIESMSRFYPVWNIVAKEYGMGENALSEEDFYGYGGVPLGEIVKALHRRHRRTEATEDFVKQFIARKKEVHAAREATVGPPPAIDCVVKIARDYVARGIPVVAATSGLREHVEAHLKANGLDDIFPPERIVCAADLPPGRGKPQPDIFVKAASLAGADPKQCIAYEDAEAGFEAAYRAGCQVVDVRHLDGYPATDALKRAMQRQVASRTFLDNQPRC